MQSPTEGGFSITILQFSISDLVHQQLSTYIFLRLHSLCYFSCDVCCAVQCYAIAIMGVILEFVSKHIICTRAAMTSGEEEIYKVILGPGFTLDILTVCQGPGCVCALFCITSYSITPPYQHHYPVCHYRQPPVVTGHIRPHFT